MADEAKIETISKILAADANNPEAFPKDVLPDLWQRVFKNSVAQTVGGSVPLTLRGVAVPIPVGRATAGYIDEGQVAPESTLTSKTKIIKPHKVATIIVYSDETARANPLAEYARIQRELADAIARAIDCGVFLGRDPVTGSAIPGVEALTAAQTQTLDLASAKAGQLTSDLSDAYDKVVLNDDEDYDFTSFVLSPKLRGNLVKAADTTGRPLYQQSPNLRDSWATVLGVPAVFSKHINGDGKAKDATVLGIGGDFAENLRLGFEENVTITRASEYAAGIDLFGRGLKAVKAEAVIGWGIRDVKAFVQLKAKG